MWVQCFRQKNEVTVVIIAASSGLNYLMLQCKKKNADALFKAV